MNNSIYIAVTDKGHVCGIGTQKSGLVSHMNDPRYVKANVIAEITGNDVADIMTYFFQQNKTLKARKTKMGYIVK